MNRQRHKRVTRSKISRPLLSICIATYNRGMFIGETLDSIIPQLRKEVELVVVDGASSDNTRKVVEKYAESCGNLRYVRLAEKGGVDQDFCAAVELARGEYCWLFTDDDLFDRGAVDRVVDEIRHGYDLVIVNARVLDRHCSATLAEAMLENKTDETYGPEELDALFQRVVHYVSFIGCVVIKRKLWLEREKERYFGTEFVHVGVIFQKLMTGGAKVISRPYINIRYGNAQWSARAFGIWLVSWPRLLWSFDGICAKTKRSKADPGSFRDLKTVIVYRALGAYSMDVYRKTISGSEKPSWWKTFALLIALTPVSVTNSLLTLFLSTFRKERTLAKLTLYDLSLYREKASQ